MADPNLTERQARYFAAMRASLERDSGKSLAQWVAIAKTCPEAAHRARLKWFKDRYGLLQNRAAVVLSEAFGSSSGWNDPAALIDALWTDAAARAIYAAVDARAMKLPGTIRTARKGYTAWSREFQFAAVRPIKGGTGRLGLAVIPAADGRLEPPRNESWSERLTARTILASPADVDEVIGALLEAAWQRS